MRKSRESNDGGKRDDKQSDNNDGRRKRISDQSEDARGGSNRSASQNEDDITSKRAQEFMPSMIVPGVKYPPAVSTERRRSRSEEPRRAKVASVIKIKKTALSPPTVRPTVYSSPAVDPRDQSVLQRYGPTIIKPQPLTREEGADDKTRFRKVYYGPGDTSKPDVKINLAVLSQAPKFHRARSPHADVEEGRDQPFAESSEPNRGTEPKTTVILVPPNRRPQESGPSTDTSRYVSAFGTQPNVTERADHRFRTVRVGPYDTSKDNVKINITVLGKRLVRPRPPPPPPKPPAPQTIPLPPPRLQSLEKPRPPSRSKALLEYLDKVSGLSLQDLEHDKVPSPEFADDKIDVIELLTKFGIPDQGKALDSLLDSDPVHFDFGGLMRQYYSYVLRSYILINMQDRYRGASNSADCLTSIDLSKIGTRDEEMSKQTRLKLRKLDEKREQLRTVARDTDHFEYLKSLAYNLPTLLPLTIVHMMNEQMAPTVEDIFRFYGKNLGTDHTCTKEAGFHYMKIRKRCEMYNNICGGSTLNEDLTVFYK